MNSFASADNTDDVVASPSTTQVKKLIKLCPRKAQTCALPLFCNHDLDTNPMTLKVKGDLDILKMHLDTEMKLLA